MARVAIPDTIRLMRPANALVAAIGAYVGALLAMPAGALSWLPSREVGAAMLAAFAFAAAGNIRNDLGDIAIDRRAHPDRPLARGSVTVSSAMHLAIGLYLLALGAGLAVGWIGSALVLGAIPVMEAYERFAKARGLPGNILVGLLTGAPFILGAIAVAPVLPGLAVLALAGLAALATIGREVLKDVEDVDADRPYRTTLPMRVGTRRAAHFAAAFFLAAVALSPLPWLLETVLAGPYLVAVGAADVCFLVAAATGARAPGRGQRLAKLGMVAALLALVLGRALVG